MAVAFALPIAGLGVCTEFEEIFPIRLPECWVLLAVLRLPCRTVPAPAVRHQEPLLGLCLCRRRTNLLPLGPCFLFSTTSFLCKCCVFHEIAVRCFQTRSSELFCTSEPNLGYFLLLEIRQPVLTAGGFRLLPGFARLEKCLII